MIGGAISPMVAGFLFHHVSPMAIWHYNIVNVAIQVAQARIRKMKFLPILVPKTFNRCNFLKLVFENTLFRYITYHVQRQCYIFECSSDIVLHAATYLYP
jgi:hypothetical protein